MLLHVNMMFILFKDCGVVCRHGWGAVPKSMQLRQLTREPLPYTLWTDQLSSRATNFTGYSITSTFQGLGCSL